MAIIENAQMTPRETIEHDWELDMFKRQAEHATTMKRLDIEAKKLELQLRHEEAIRARKHSEAMKELEFAIRYEETRWRSVIRIPLMIIKLPVYLFVGVGCMVKLIRNQEIPKDIIELIK